MLVFMYIYTHVYVYMKDYQKVLINSYEFRETITHLVFLSVQKRATLTRQMSVSLSDVKNSFLILEKTESLSPIQYLFLETAFRVKRDKGSHPSRFPSCLSSIFTSNFHRDGENTNTLHI